MTMRKIVVSEFLTADGVMQGPGDADEDREGGFEHGGWQRAFEFDDDQMQKIGQGMQETDAYLFGRKTYEIFARHWPNQPDTDPFASVLNPRPKYVVSRTLSEPLPWQNSTLINDNAIERIRDLKQQDGGAISVLGSGELVQALLENDLVDELSLFVHPLVLGSGKRLFREGLPPLKLELTDSSIAKDGTLSLSYRPTRS
jgi:dihydrofolate reductase